MHSRRSGPESRRSRRSLAAQPRGSPELVRRGPAWRGNLTYAELTGADLTRTDLTGADLTDTVATGADLSGAGLTGAVLAGAVNLRAP
ncbi:pentapeptide repeat-containing protein [Streptomyces pseudogriseolus]|uniref:pentapeptide repeat-containing protein n=1 Tax=Streptomyces pseudogriseolus TaxID=36817 RepID=UPI003FA2526F